MDNNETLSTISCGRWDGVVTWCALVLLILAVLIVILFSFLQKRRNFKRECCCGTPGLFPPLDFLTGQPSRLVLTLTLAGLSGHVVRNTLLQPVIFDLDNTATQITSVFIRILWILYATILFLPSVTCSATPLPILGYIVGAIYTTLLVGWYIIWVYTFQRGCLYFAIQLDVEPPELSSTVIGIAPIIGCLIGVLIWYIVHIGKETMLRIKGSKTSWFESDSTLHFNSYKYVVSLLNTKNDTPSNGAKNSNKLRLIVNKIYTNKPGFGYPLRTTVALGGAAVVLYELTFLMIPRFLTFTNNLSSSLDNTANVSCSNNENTTLCAVIDHRKAIIDGLTIFLISGPFIAFPLVMCQFIPILKSVRSHLLRGFKGDRTFVPKGVQLSSNFILVATMKYPGFQIGYLVLGWVLYALSIWLIGILLLMTIFAFIIAYSTLLFVLASIILTLVVNICVHILQLLNVKLLFVRGKPQNAQDIVITNHRLYNVFSYLLYAYNGLLGVGSAFVRSVIAAVQGLIYAPRLDVTAIKNTRLDRGHMTYLGFVQLELTQNNAIVHVFIDILVRSSRQRRQKTGQVAIPVNEVDDTARGEVESFEDSSDPSRGGQRASTLVTIGSNEIYDLLGAHWPRNSLKAYNRWHLAYCLLRNPSIIAYRYHGNKPMEISEC